MSDHTPAPENRPERCGYLRAALRTLQINASSAAKFYGDPTCHASLLAAIREIDRLAEDAIREDERLADSNRAEFERWAKRDDYRCAKCHRSAHYSNDAPGHHGHAYVPPARNTHPGLTRNEAELALPAALHVPPADVSAFLDNAAEQGRWDNSYGYATYDTARGLFTLYAYEAV